VKLERRSVFGWGASGAGFADPRSGLVVHYDSANQGLANKNHTACRTYWKNTRKFHMGPARGWADIGYSFAVCPCGYVLEGRGVRKVQAAQPGGNSTWYSCTFMSGPSEKPTAAQIRAFQELRNWLRTNYGVGAGVRGHRDFSSTACPGNILYTMVKNGSLVKPIPQPQEDDLPYTEAQLAEIIQKAVWKLDEIPAPGSNPNDPFSPSNPGFDPERNPTWAGQSFLKQTIQGLLKIDARLAAIEQRLTDLEG
jgi:N-acetylmuramoyl-L-alanine amidase